MTYFKNFANSGKNGYISVRWQTYVLANKGALKRILHNFEFLPTCYSNALILGNFEFSPTLR